MPETGVACAHLTDADDVAATQSRGCEECLASGDSWLHLRRCLACGHVGCCDSSPNRHATAHHRSTRHPVIQSFEPGETWRYCFLDELVQR
jgi:CPA1 family monovalent cation:H+ antiporter